MNKQVIHMHNFGEYIRHLRKGRGLTLTQLAAKLNLDSANLSKIENSKRELDEKRIAILCGIFGLDFEEVTKDFLSEKYAKEVLSKGLRSDVFDLAFRKFEYYKENLSKQGKLEF